MDIPGLWENYSKSTGARVGPGSGLLLDVAEQLQRGRLGPFEGASVAVFPDHPWHEEGGGREALEQRFRCILPGLQPPVHE